MSRLFALCKMNIRLLFRNKGFLFFLCITPVLSAIILNLKVTTAIYEDKGARTNIAELDDIHSKAVYVGDTSAYIIKVYDASATELSEYLLKSFASSGMFSVCRCDVSDMTEAQIEEQAKEDAFNDRAGTLLYLKREFENGVLDGNYDDAIRIYVVSDDERWELFETELTETLEQISYAAQYTGRDSGKIIGLLKDIENEIPKKQVISLSGTGEIVLTDEQINHKTLIGYAFAIITLGFLFCGVYAAHTVIEEQNNKVYTRVMLSKLSRREYFGSKFLMAFVISIVQTFLLGISIFVVRDIDFGINKYGFLFIILCLGLIFSTLSLLLGILLGDVMSANYAVFTVWSLSALLSGLYFSIEDTSITLKSVSYLMPQRWFMKAIEILLSGDKSAYTMVLYITAAYLILGISVGGIGLKMKRCES